MSLELVDRLVNAVLYEGYILYPYRPSSIKNRQRFTFGRIYPHAFSEAQHGAEPCASQTQCLLRQLNTEAPVLTIKVRFLHPLSRIVGRLPKPLSSWSDEIEPDFLPVAELRVESRIYQTWQEAVEQEVTQSLPLSQILEHPQEFRFALDGSRTIEPISDEQGLVVGLLERRQSALEGLVEVSASRVDEQVAQVTVRVMNTTPFPQGEIKSTEDDAVIMRTFASAHTILTVQGGEFISLLEPPVSYVQVAANCQNQGVFPVLVGSKERCDTLLSSPIILYDFPEIAPESRGDLFDSTEIDEILTLRIMSMTDDEKSEMSQVDERARQLLQRTEALLSDDLLDLHGTLREMRPIRRDSV